MKFAWHCIILGWLVVGASEIRASGLPKDDYLHLNFSIGERYWLSSYRIGYQGFEAGQINQTSMGVVYRLAKDWLTCSLGFGYGSEGFGPFGGGLIGEVGVHHVYSKWLDLRADISNFVTAQRTQRSELLLGVGLHL